MQTFRRLHLPKAMTALLGVGLLAACDPAQLDMDMRSYGKGFDTTDAVTGATLRRPSPDARGVISYPTYQVALARNGETVAQVAERLGISPNELANYNGLNTGDTLQRDELLALPRKIDDSISAAPTVATTSLGTAQPVDITSLAGNAIDTAPNTISPGASSAAPAAVTAQQTPIRHKVARGETAFIIARQYGVTVRSLGEWNGLDSNFTVREGQVLLVPVSQATADARPATTAVATKPQSPGTGSPTPTPPSATVALPAEKTTAAATPVETPAAPKVQQTAKSGGRLGWPVSGNIVRDYAKGKNDGIDIASTAGAPVKAAADGTVAAITADANQVPILVLKHANNLLTVYAYIDDLAVKKGDTIKRGQTIAKVRKGSPAILHFEVRDGFESVDPTDYLNN